MMSNFYSSKPHHLISIIGQIATKMMMKKCIIVHVLFSRLGCMTAFVRQTWAEYFQLSKYYSLDQSSDPPKPLFSLLAETESEAPKPEPKPIVNRKCKKAILAA